jgi:hypothetical protein
MSITILKEVVQHKLDVSVQISENNIYDVCDATEKGNERLFDQVNKIFLETAEREPIAYSFAVTGEMQTLGLRNFRLACRKIYDNYGAYFEIVGHIPGISDSLELESYLGRLILKWWHERWGRSPGNFDILYCLSIPIHIYLLPETPRIHFGVFANRYVLVQNEHLHNMPKQMWILRGDKNFIEPFKVKFEDIKKQACPVFQVVREKILNSINSLESVQLLFWLSKEKEISKRKLYAFSKSVSEIIGDLQSAGFIQNVGEYLQITDLGISYVELLRKFTEMRWWGGRKQVKRIA